MSYDIRLDCELEQPHNLQGGTYAVGGTTEPWLNVTYNYSHHFYRVMGEKGVRSIYGLTARQSVPVLLAAIDQLGTDTSDDYWQATEGNAREALCGLLTIAVAAIAEGKGGAQWSGD